MLQRGSLVIVQLKRYPWKKGTLSGYFALITTSSLLSSTLALAVPTIIVETVYVRSRRVRCYSCGLRDRSLDVSKRCCSHLKKRKCMRRKRAKHLVSQSRTSISVKTSETRNPHHDDDKDPLFIQLYSCCSSFYILEYPSWLLNFPDFLVEFGRVKLPFRNYFPSITGSLNVLRSNS